jgi:hypothetical protein
MIDAVLRSSRADGVEAIEHRVDGASPPRLEATLPRELDRLELVRSQLAVVEANRDWALQTDDTVSGEVVRQPPPRSAVSMLIRSARSCCACGVLARRLLQGSPWKRLLPANRREIGAYSGLTPSPWKRVAVSIRSKGSQKPCASRYHMAVQHILLVNFIPQYSDSCAILLGWMELNGLPMHQAKASSSAFALFMSTV